VTETHVERRRRLLRDDIGRLAIDLFATRGFDEVTVDDIAEAAGISQRTFFRYFASKDAIVLDLARRAERRLVETFDARPDDEGAVTALGNAYRITSHVEPSNRERVVQLARILGRTPELQAQAHGEYVRDTTGLIERVAARMGVKPSDRRARVLVTATSAVVAVEFQRWADTDGKGDPSDAIGAALDVLREGFDALDRAPS
jgi:AcrR family transcriptional regulator